MLINKLLTVFCFLLFSHVGYSNEVDHFTTKKMPLADSTKAFNKWFNSSLDLAVNSLNIVKENALGGSKGCSEEYLLDNISEMMRLNKWAAFEEELINLHPEIPRIALQRKDSIYADASSKDQPILANHVHNLAPIVSINGVRIGSDKLGHFFSQGLILYQNRNKRPSPSDKGWRTNLGNKVFRGMGTANRIADNRIFREAYGLVNGPKYEMNDIKAKKIAAVDSLFDEDTAHGMKSNGVLSYADVAANYDGFNFWSEFYGKYVTCKDGKYKKIRDFDWKEWVNEAWDESINCSEYEPKFKTKITERMKSLEKKLNLNLQCPLDKSVCAKLTLRYLDVYPYVLSPSCRDFSHMKKIIDPKNALEEGFPNSCPPK